MATEVGTAFVRILPSTQGFGRALQGSVVGQAGAAGTAAGQRLGSGMLAAARGFVGPVAAAFGAAAVAKQFGAAIGSASDLGESINALNVVYTKFGDEVPAEIRKISDESARTFGLSSKDFNELAVRFSSFVSTVAGKGGDITGTLDELVGRATDFASVMNLDVAEAAALFQSGLAGETEPLRRFGLDLSAAAVEAFAYANGIAESGEKLTEAQKVQARYALLLEQTADTQGDFANTSDSLANRQRILAASFENVRAKLGTAFLPVAERVVAWAQESFLPAFERAIDFVTGRLIPGISDLIGILFRGDYTGGLASLFGNAGLEDSPLVAFLFRVREQGQRAIDFVTDRLVPALGDAIGILFRGDYGGGLQRLFGDAALEDSALVSFLFNIRDAGLIVVGVLRDRVVPAIQGFFSFISENREAVATFAGGIAAVATAFKGLSIVTGIIKGITGAFASFSAVLAANPVGLVLVAIGALVGGLIYLYNNSEAFRDAVQEAWAAIRDAVAAAWQRLQPFFDRLGEAWNDLIAALGPLREALSDLWETLEPIVTAIAERVAPIIAGLFEGLVARLEGAVRVIAGIFQTITGILTGDSEKLREGLSTIWQGIQTALIGTVEGLWEGIKEAFAGGGEAVGGFLADLGPRLGEWWAGAWRAAGNAVREGIEAILERIAAVPGEVLAFLIALPGNLRQLGVNAFNALRAGIVFAWPRVLDFIKTIPGRIATNFGNVRDLLRDVGQNIVRGLVDGIKSFTQWAIDQAKEFAGNVIQGIKDALGIASPSKVFAELGTEAVAGFVQGLSRDREVSNAVGRLAGAAIPSVNSLTPARVGLASAAASPTGVSNVYQFGDINGVSMEDAMRYADRKRRLMNAGGLT